MRQIYTAETTSVSVNSAPQVYQVIYDHICEITLKQVNYHVIHVFYGSNSGEQLLKIFSWELKRFWKMNSLLNYYPWYDWLTEGREIRSDKKWLSFISKWLPYFSMTEFYQYKMTFLLVHCPLWLPVYLVFSRKPRSIRNFVPQNFFVYIEFL